MGRDKPRTACTAEWILVAKFPGRCRHPVLGSAAAPRGHSATQNATQLLSPPPRLSSTLGIVALSVASPTPARERVRSAERGPPLPATVSLAPVAADLRTSPAQRAPRWSVPASTTQRTTARRRRALGAFWLVALAVPFGFLLFASVGPLVDQAFGSFFNWYDIHPKSFAGLHYYGQVLADPVASAALVHTAIYVGITVPVEVVLGLGGAWLVYRAKRGRALLTALFVLPLGDPVVVDGDAVFRPSRRH